MRETRFIGCVGSHHAELGGTPGVGVGFLEFDAGRVPLSYFRPAGRRPMPILGDSGILVGLHSRRIVCNSAAGFQNRFRGGTVGSVWRQIAAPGGLSLSSLNQRFAAGTPPAPMLASQAEQRN